MAKKTFLQGAIFGSLAIVFGLSSVAFAAGSIGGRPANPDPDNPRSQSIFIYNLKGGETKKDQLYLSNNGDTTETVRLYAVDGTVTNTGAFTCKQEVEPREDIGKGITLAKNEVTVPAGQNMLIDFSLTLPQHADVGEHDGCIVIQKKDDAGQQTGAVVVHTRTAVRVAVIVPGDIHRQVSIEDFDAGQVIKDSQTETHISRTVAPAGTLSMQFGLKNSGNVSADVDTQVSVRDLFGNEVAHNGGQYAVIAGTTFGVNYDANFQPFFGGWYKVKAKIAYDKQAGSFGIAKNAQLLQAEGPEVIVFLWPSIWFLVVIGLLLAGLVFFILWRRSQAKQAPARARKTLKKPLDQTMWGPYEVKEGDTLEVLARRSGEGVNKIALLNKLKAPYNLEPGQKIYLPRKK